jgi:hypothetical protein
MKPGRERVAGRLFARVRPDCGDRDSTLPYRREFKGVAESSAMRTFIINGVSIHAL